MLLIVEGANYTGKTYVSKHLSSVLNLPVYKTLLSLGKDKDEKFQQELNIYPSYIADLYLADIYGQVELNMISERSFPSGYIYESASDFQKEYWEKMLLKTGKVLIVYLSASPEFLYERGKDLRNSDRGFTLEQLRVLCNHYEEYMKTSKLPVIKIDVSDKNSVIEKILMEVKPYGFYSKR